MEIIRKIYKITHKTKIIKINKKYQSKGIIRPWKLLKFKVMISIVTSVIINYHLGKL